MAKKTFTRQYKMTQCFRPLDRKLTLGLSKLKQIQQTQVNAIYYIQLYIHLICCFHFVGTLTFIDGLYEIFTNIPQDFFTDTEATIYFPKCP